MLRQVRVTNVQMYKSFYNNRDTLESDNKKTI